MTVAEEQIPLRDELDDRADGVGATDEVLARQVELALELDDRVEGAGGRVGRNEVHVIVPRGASDARVETTVAQVLVDHGASDG